MTLGQICRNRYSYSPPPTLSLVGQSIFYRYKNRIGYFIPFPSTACTPSYHNTWILMTYWNPALEGFLCSTNLSGRQSKGHPVPGETPRSSLGFNRVKVLTAKWVFSELIFRPHPGCLLRPSAWAHTMHNCGREHTDQHRHHFPVSDMMVVLDVVSSVSTHCWILFVPSSCSLRR